MSTQTVSEVLSKAADLLEKGWVQGEMHVGFFRHRYCAIGAIQMAATGHTNSFFFLRTDLEHQAHDVVAESIGVVSLSAWNDALGRTQAEVVSAFRAAAKAAA